MPKVLIIKTGYSELVENGSGRVVSLGDVFWHTVLLHLYEDDEVTWLTSRKAYPLLEGNPYIDRVLIYEEIAGLPLKEEHFDAVINLEKGPEMYALAESIAAGERLGFGLGDDDVLGSDEDLSSKRNNHKPFQEIVYEMVGAKWREEDYILGYRPKTVEVHNVGFNTEVGPKWGHKAWAWRNWEKLEPLLLSEGITISWQKDLYSLQNYIDWLNSCRVIITNDSLGMHLGLALKKRVVALFGPTSWKKVHMYARGYCLAANSTCPHMPCYSSPCKRGLSCINEIKVEEVYRKVKDLLEKDYSPSKFKEQRVKVNA